MHEKRLRTLVNLIALFNALHLVDHVVRGDFHWPIDGQSVAFVAIIVVMYGVLGLGLVWYRRHRIGPRFWMLVGAVGLAFGWLSHCSPFTDQPLAVIVGAYASRVVGWLALTCLLVLMLLVLMTTVYAGYLWRTTRSQARVLQVGGS